MATPATSLLQAAQQALAFAPAFAAIEGRLGMMVKAPKGSAGAPEIEPLDWTKVRLEDVGFRHESSGGVEGVTLELERGQWLGLEGPSAGGKTTLADLIAGLLAPQRGRITVDGSLLSGPLLERWRPGLAYVGQEGLVFADSIAANLGADRAGVTEDEMWAALELDDLAGRVRAFPGGLEHFLGESGSALSGGERQRLLIARAVLRRPTLLILDESTAALDPDAEATILERLKSLESRPAGLVVAHRESTLAHCDSRLAVQHGSVQQAGARR